VSNALEDLVEWKTALPKNDIYFNQSSIIDTNIQFLKNGKDDNPKRRYSAEIALEKLTAIKDIQDKIVRNI
jgi:hypothetical protein